MLFLRSILPLLMLVTVVLTPLTPAAELPILKPQDFKPLTELPWKKKGEKVAELAMEDVMAVIMREPNATIRIMVLQLYLNEIPVEQISRAFNLATELENSQTPDELVKSMLLTWARRDPRCCWERVQKLFGVVGLENGWLIFDDWDVNRSTLLVQDRPAIQASPFRLMRHGLLGFPAGVDESELPSTDRVRLMQDFLRRWFESFDTWPDSYGEITNVQRAYYFAEAFQKTGDNAQGFCESMPEHDYHFASVSIALRCWMVDEPHDASDIIEFAHRTGGASILELIRLWADVDHPGLLKWADSSSPQEKDGSAILARGLLMSNVDAATRERWLAEARGKERDDDDLTESMLESWAVWDPKAALEYAAKLGDPDIINSVANSAADGPYPVQTVNAGRFGFYAVRDFDLTALPESVRESMLDNWGMSPMEGWGGIDAGATVRFGIAQLNRYGWYGFPKDEVIEFFAGRNNEYRDNGSVIDRTFCSLRTWAATKPTEMKAWVATLPDVKLREALTWLADNPWGPGRIPPP